MSGPPGTPHGAGPGEENARTLQAYESASELYALHHRQPHSTITFIDRFAALLDGHGSVLEIGSATGADARLLEQRGLRVQLSDATPAFVRALRADGRQALALDVTKDPLRGPWDGIYANAVLLHLNRAQLVDALARMVDATRPGGILGFTVKEGDGESWTSVKLEQPRHFTYWRLEPLRALLEASPWLVVEVERVRDELDDWLHCFCRRPAAS